MTDNLKVTTTHSEIRNWVEKLHGRPQALGTNGTTIIRIDFPGKQDDTFLSEDNPPRVITWEEFFKVFEEHNLAFIYEDRPNIFDPSLAYHFIKRENMEEEKDSTFGWL